MPEVHAELPESHSLGEGSGKVSQTTTIKAEQRGVKRERGHTWLGAAQMLQEETPLKPSSRVSTWNVIPFWLLLCFALEYRLGIKCISDELLNSNSRVHLLLSSMSHRENSNPG